jgi:hypothetical protein
MPLLPFFFRGCVFKYSEIYVRYELLSAGDVKFDVS